MKKLVLPLLLLLLTACPKEKEVKEMIEDMDSRRQQAVSTISNQDFSLNGLLRAQEYFFDFSEKVHLMKEDAKSLENIKLLMRKEGMQKFCNRFIVSIRIWNELERYCVAGGEYRCSPDIQAYPQVQIRFLDSIGSDLHRQFQEEPACH